LYFSQHIRLVSASLSVSEAFCFQKETERQRLQAEEEARSRLCVLYTRLILPGRFALSSETREQFWRASWIQRTWMSKPASTWCQDSMTTTTWTLLKATVRMLPTTVVNFSRAFLRALPEGW
ncbi:unnamed protein product, partial [Sphacelaria rigidula]